MNRDLRFDRAYLRAQVWPLLEKRWPGAATALSRTAHHVAEAQELLDASAAPTVQRLRDGDALAVSGLRALTNLERINAVRHWLFAAEVTPPPASRLTEALRQVFAADADHLPAIVWGEHALRRYQDRLFLTPAQLPAVGEPLEWQIAPGSILNSGLALGRLRWISQDGGLDAGRLPPTLSVRQRRGGEVLKPSRRAKTQNRPAPVPVSRCTAVDARCAADAVRGRWRSSRSAISGRMRAGAWPRASPVSGALGRCAGAAGACLSIAAPYCRGRFDLVT